MDFRDFVSDGGMMIRDVEKAQKMVDAINDIRVNHILRECGALVEEMKEKECGLYLETVGGWFHAVRIDPAAPVNTILWEDRKI